MFRAFLEYRKTTTEKQLIQDHAQIAQNWQEQAFPHFPRIHRQPTIEELRALYYLQHGQELLPWIFIGGCIGFFGGISAWNRMNPLSRAGHFDWRIECTAIALLVNEKYCLVMTNDYLASTRWISLQDLPFQYSPLKRGVCEALAAHGFPDAPRHEAVADDKELRRMHELLQTCDREMAKNHHATNENVGKGFLSKWWARDESSSMVDEMADPPKSLDEWIQRELSSQDSAFYDRRTWGDKLRAIVYD